MKRFRKPAGGRATDKMEEKGPDLKINTVIIVLQYKVNKYYQYHVERHINNGNRRDNVLSLHIIYV